MGFSGLATYTDSDTAADLAFVAIRAMCKELRKGLKDKGNDWNTCGIDNVALFFETFILPVEEYSTYDEVIKLAVDTKANLDKIAKAAKGTEFAGDYKRMVKSLQKVIDRNF